MATWVTSWASSQSRKAKSSAAVVPKVRTCCSRAPFDAGTRTQAATVCLCTSSPHTRSISRSMVPPPRVVSPVPGGASFARLCSACSMATMRGADSSHVRLFADSRYQLQSTFPGIRRAVSIDDFHDARVCPRLMAIIFGLGLAAPVDSNTTHPRRLPTQMFFEERERLRPGIAVGFRVIPGPASIHERVVRTGIRVELVRLPMPVELRVELAHIGRGWVGVVRAEEPDQRAMNLGRPLEGRRTFPPRSHDVAPVVVDGGPERRLRGRHEVGHPAPHAEPHDAQPVAVDRAV